MYLSIFQFNVLKQSCFLTTNKAISKAFYSSCCAYSAWLKMQFPQSCDSSLRSNSAKQIYSTVMSSNGSQSAYMRPRSSWNCDWASKAADNLQAWQHSTPTLITPGYPSTVQLLYICDSPLTSCMFFTVSPLHFDKIIHNHPWNSFSLTSS